MQRSYREAPLDEKVFRVELKWRIRDTIGPAGCLLPVAAIVLLRLCMMTVLAVPVLLLLIAIGGWVLVWCVRAGRHNSTKIQFDGHAFSVEVGPVKNAGARSLSVPFSELEEARVCVLGTGQKLEIRKRDGSTQRYAFLPVLPMEEMAALNTGIARFLEEMRS